MKTIEELARPANDHYHRELVDRYRRVSIFLPTLLRTICFQSTQAGRPVFEALRFFKTSKSKKKWIPQNVPLKVISSSWKRLVLGQKGSQINRQAYTLCVLEKLQDDLRRRDIFVPSSSRWGDPRAKLLQGQQWENTRMQVSQSLGLSLEPENALQKLANHLDASYRQAVACFRENDALRIEQEKGKSSLVISNLEKIEEPPSLIKLRRHVSALLPRVDLPKILLEIHTHTRFTDAFTHVSESRSRIDDLPISMSAVLLSEACNIGLEPLIRPDNLALTHNRLSWAQQNYFRAETLMQANACLVKYHSNLVLTKIWGGGDVASADGLRFVTPLKTVNARPNRKYFGSGRGITYYNFVSDQYTGFHSIVVPGTLRDSIFILEGLLEQQTHLRPKEIMTDTAAASEIVFGLFWLLGYQFSPRLADSGGERYWRIDAGADYGILNAIARSCVNIDRIKKNWEDLLRIAGSLKLGKVSASELMRSLLKSDRPSSLARSLAELGRIPKTIHLLNFINDENYRRRILRQLNRIEGRHSLARVICHGKHGEIRKKYREGQEDQLNALGLVTNAIILWNTIYVEKILNHLRKEGSDIRNKDVARLSPLQHAHINFLGRYSFTVTEQIEKGELRDLHIPDAYDRLLA